MIHPTAYRSVARGIAHAHHNAKHSARAVLTSLCVSIEMQAHRALCDQLRTLAARIVMESP